MCIFGPALAGHGAEAVRDRDCIFDTFTARTASLFIDLSIRGQRWHDMIRFDWKRA